MGLRRQKGLYLLLTTLLLAGMMAPNLPEAATNAPQAVADNDCESASLPHRVEVGPPQELETTVATPLAVGSPSFVPASLAASDHHGLRPPVRAPPPAAHIS